MYRSRTTDAGCELMVRYPSSFILASCWLMMLVSLDGAVSDHGSEACTANKGSEGDVRRLKKNVRLMGQDGATHELVHAEL